MQQEQGCVLGVTGFAVKNSMLVDGGSAVMDHGLISLCRLDFHYLAWWRGHKQCVNSYADFPPLQREPNYWISATSRRSRACTPTFRFLEKMLRPSPPTLRDARNAEQSLDLFPISSINSKCVPNRETVLRSFDDSDLIFSANRALNDDTQVCPGSQRFGKSAHKPLIVHPNSQPPARDPRFGYFKYAGADRPTLANERVVHRDSFRREVFPELAVLKRSFLLLLPPPQIFYGVHIHRFVGPPVRFTIGLIVSFKIYPSGRDTAGNRRFPNRAFGRSTVIIKLAHASDID